MCYAGPSLGFPRSEQRFRAIHGFYVAELQAHSEMYSLSHNMSHPVSELTPTANITFRVEMTAEINTTTLGTDYTINATVTGCPSSAGVMTNNCPQSCALALFNAADYTATFSQCPDGSFDHGSFEVYNGVKVKSLQDVCKSAEDFNEGEEEAHDLLFLLAAQVDTR